MKIYTFRKRLVQTVEESQVEFVPIEFDEMKTVYFLNSIKTIEKPTAFQREMQVEIALLVTHVSDLTI